MVRFVAAAALAIAGGLAGAAPAAAQTFDWTGFYVGLVAGQTSAMSSTTDILFNDTYPLDIPPIDMPVVGAMAGVTAGVNQQHGAFVFGAEADVSLSMAAGQNDDYLEIYGFSSEGHLLNFATLRGRAGVAFDRVLLYATAGVAAGNMRATLHDYYDDGATLITTTDTAMMLGWTAGVGGEIAVADNVSIKGEALLYDLGSADLAVSEGAEYWESITFSTALRGAVVRVGINVHID